MQMALKVKKEAPGPLSHPYPQAEAKTKALEGLCWKTVPQGVHSHKNKICTPPNTQMAQDTVSAKIAQKSLNEHLQEKET